MVIVVSFIMFKMLKKLVSQTLAKNIFVSFQNYVEIPLSDLPKVMGEYYDSLTKHLTTTVKSHAGIFKELREENKKDMETTDAKITELNNKITERLEQFDPVENAVTLDDLETVKTEIYNAISLKGEELQTQIKEINTSIERMRAWARKLTGKKKAIEDIEESEKKVMDF